MQKESQVLHKKTFSESGLSWNTSARYCYHSTAGKAARQTDHPIQCGGDKRDQKVVRKGQRLRGGMVPPEDEIRHLVAALP